MPRIVATTPAQRQVTIQVGPVSASCPRPALSVTVHDDDLTDTTNSLWFVDAAADFKPTIASPAIAGSPVLDGTAPERTVTSPSSIISRLSQLIDGRQHRVDVWVTDGVFEADSIEVVRPSVALPDGGMVVDCSRAPDGGTATRCCDAAYEDNYVWLVEVQACP